MPSYVLANLSSQIRNTFGIIEKLLSGTQSRFSLHISLFSYPLIKATPFSREILSSYRKIRHLPTLTTSDVQSPAPSRQSPGCRAVEAEPSRALLDSFVGLRARLALNEALSRALQPRLYSTRHVDLHVMYSNLILSICTVFQPPSENENTHTQETQRRPTKAHELGKFS